MTGKEKILSSVQFISCFLGIAGASLICYWGMNDVFFVADDFIWLERAKYLTERPLSIFISEGLYFDPLVYLLFGINHILGGFEPRWYHLVDLFIHVINAFLVFYLAMLLTENKIAALFSGLIFAIWPINADAVLWPSSRVDTLSAIFFMGSIISYIHYQRKEKTLFYCLSLLSFIMALSAKSTPIILPLVIIALEMVSSNKTGYKAIFLRLILFFTISGIYLTLLYVNSPQAIVETAQVSRLNIKELLKGITVLFFPESLIAAKENVYMALAVLLFISITGMSAFFISGRFTLVISVMIGAIMVPLLFMSASYVYATPSNPPAYLLGSICHRLYLASIGFSILMGINVAFFINRTEKYGRLPVLVLAGLLTMSILAYGFIYVTERKEIWNSFSKKYRLYVSIIKDMVVNVENPSQLSKIYIISLPRSFIESMFRLYFNNSELVVEQLEDYTLTPDIRSSGKETAVLMLNKHGRFEDITEEIRIYQSMLNTCGGVRDEKEIDACLQKLSVQAQFLNNLLIKRY